MKRVGILTSGGDCQALNATMRGVGKGLYNELGSDVEIYGFERFLEAPVSLLKICAYRMKMDWTR